MIVKYKYLIYNMFLQRIIKGYEIIQRQDIRYSSIFLLNVSTARTNAMAAVNTAVAA